MKVDPLSHVMIVDEAMRYPEERKKLITPVNFEGPYDRCCYFLSTQGRISLLIDDEPGRGKSTFLFTILAKGPRPTFERRKTKADEHARSEPECLKNPQVFDQIFEMPRKFYSAEKLNMMSEEELRKLFEESKYVMIDDIHFLNEKALSVLKRALETFNDLNIIATSVPTPEKEATEAPISMLNQVKDRFKKRARIDPVDPQALKRILTRRLVYALQADHNDPKIKSVIESIASTISFFATFAGGYITVRRGIIYLRDYLRGELLRDFETIIQNFFEDVNVRATMAPHTLLADSIKDDSIEYSEIRLTSEGVLVEKIKLKEPAIVATVSYSAKSGQVRFYGKIGGRITPRRRLQIPDIITKQVVIKPEIIVMHVATNNTNVVLHPEVSPPLELIDKFGDLVRDIYFELVDANKPINAQTLVYTYRKIQREIRKRPELQKYLELMQEKLGFSSMDFAIHRLIIYRSLKAISEIFPRIE